MVPAAQQPVSAAPITLLLIGAVKAHANLLKDLARASGRIAIAGEAPVGGKALEMAVDLAPDVILYCQSDSGEQQPAGLKEIMKHRPTPIVVLQDTPFPSPSDSFNALRDGAVACIDASVLEEADETAVHSRLTRLLLSASRMKPNRPVPIPPSGRGSRAKGPSCAILFCEECGTRNLFQPEDQQRPGNLRCANCGDLLLPAQVTPYRKAGFITVIGAGDGGVRNLLHIIPRLPRDLSGSIIIILDETVERLSAFVDFLARASRFPVLRLEDGGSIEGGRCYVAAASLRLGLKPLSTRHTMQSADPGEKLGPLDHALCSVASVFKQNCAGLILSGGGIDGVEGIRQIKTSGGTSAILFAAHCLRREMGEKILRSCAVDKIVDEESAVDFLIQLHEQARRGVSTA